MLLAIKANGVEGVLACWSFADAKAARGMRVAFEQDVAMHRLVNAVVARWGEEAFGDTPETLDSGLLAASDRMIDELMDVVDKSKVRPWMASEYVYLDASPEGGRDFVLAPWHKAFTVLPFGFFDRTAEGWKLWVGRSELRPKGAKEAMFAEVFGELGASTRRLAEETERGGFGTVAELVRELEARDQRLERLIAQ